jgi:peptidyl-prolyl cis-trans isomerase C
MSVRPIVVTLTLALALAGGCRRGDGDKRSTKIATVGAHAISAADFKARAAEESFGLARYKSLDRKKELLEGMIRSELLVQEARRQHLDARPEVRSAIERVLIQSLARVYAEEAHKANPVPESELRRFYEQRRHEFVTPTRVRVSHVFLAAAERDPKRSLAAAAASRLLAQVKSKQESGTKQALQLAASQRSDDATTKATGGDLGMRTKEELAQLWGAPFADAVLALKTANEIGPVISTPKGFHLVVLLGRYEGFETSFEAARSRIASRLDVERRTRSVDDLVADLKKKTKVTIDDKTLGAIDVSKTDHAASPGSSGPGPRPAVGLR